MVTVRRNNFDVNLGTPFGFVTIYHMYETCYQTSEPQDIMCHAKIQKVSDILDVRSRVLL